MAEITPNWHGSNNEELGDFLKEEEEFALKQRDLEKEKRTLYTQSKLDEIGFVLDTELLASHELDYMPLDQDLSQYAPYISPTVLIREGIKVKIPKNSEEEIQWENFGELTFDPNRLLFERFVNTLRSDERLKTELEIRDEARKTLDSLYPDLSKDITDEELGKSIDFRVRDGVNGVRIVGYNMPTKYHFNHQRVLDSIKEGREFTCKGLTDSVVQSMEFDDGKNRKIIPLSDLEGCDNAYFSVVNFSGGTKIPLPLFIRGFGEDLYRALVRDYVYVEEQDYNSDEHGGEIERCKLVGLVNGFNYDSFKDFLAKALPNCKFKEELE